MHEEGLSASTARKAHGLLPQTLKAAVRNRMLHNNPAEGASFPREERKEMLYLSPNQVQRLADAIPKRTSGPGLHARLRRHPTGGKQQPYGAVG